MLVGATWPGCLNVMFDGWSPEVRPQVGFRCTKGGIITPCLSLLHKTKPPTWTLAHQGQGLQKSDWYQGLLWGDGVQSQGSLWALMQKRGAGGH